MPEVVTMDIPECFRGATLHGKKVCHTCITVIGLDGDEFEAFGARFRIIVVRKQRLDEVKYHHWMDEGCTSPADFEAYWTALHPSRPYRPLAEYHTHYFRRVFASDPPPEHPALRRREEQR